MKNQTIIYKDGELELPVEITPDKDTVWLTQEQMSILFDTARSSITYHINNIFKEGELNKNTSVEKFDKSNNLASRPPLYYNLDIIISDSTLVAITLLLAESRPEEKEIMIDIIMNFLEW